MNKTKLVIDKYKTMYCEIKTKYHSLNTFTQVMFLCTLGIYVFGFVVQTTMFDVHFGGTISGFALKLLVLLAAVRAFFTLERGKQLAAASCFAAVLFLLYQFKADSLLIFLGIMAIGCVGLDYKRVLKTQTIVISVTVAVAVVASLTCTIQNLVYLKDQVSIRDSFGICYPTDFASYLFFAFLFFWIAWKKIPCWVSLIISIPFMIIVHWYALSDTCTICGILFILVLAVLPFVKKLLVAKGNIPFLKKCMDCMLVLTYPLLASFMFFLIFLFSREAASGNFGFAYKINKIITSRLSLAHNAFVKYGITVFGSELKQQGNGSTTFKMVGYDFVDSSYPLMLLRNGVIIFILISIIWVVLTYRAVKAKEYRLAFGMALIAVHSFIEHHFPEPYYNIILFLPFAMISEDKKTEMKAEDNKQKKWRSGVCFATIVVLFILGAPWILANMRTVCGMLRANESDVESGFVIIAVLVILVVISLICIGFNILLNAKIEKSNLKKGIPYLAGGFALLIAGLIFISLQVRNACKEVESSWMADSKILTRIDTEATGEIYSTEYPIFYNKHLKKLKYGIVTGDDLARKQNTTLIVPKGTEYYVLFNKGFAYSVISETTAVYTNDGNVLKCMENLGLKPKNYCDEIRYVEIPTNTAKLINLRKGTYSIHYLMNIKANDEMPEEVAELTIVGNKGYSIIAKEMIAKGLLTESGKLDYTITIDLENDMPAMMFYTLGKNGCTLDVKEVSYQRIQ